MEDDEHVAWACAVRVEVKNAVAVEAGPFSCIARPDYAAHRRLRRQQTSARLSTAELGPFWRSGRAQSDTAP